MNELKRIHFSDRRLKGKCIITLFYFSMPHGKRINHCEIFKANNVSRVILNQSSFTLWFKGDYVRISVNENFDLKPLIEMVDLITGSGLQVIEHFSNFRNMDNFKEQKEA